MKISRTTPAREIEAGFENKIIIKDCGIIHLESDEQVTFLTALGGEYDVTKKEWGFYMGPSLNGRLSLFKLSPVLVKNRQDKFYMLLVEEGKEKSFGEYLEEQQLTLVGWMNTAKAIESIIY